MGWQMFISIAVIFIKLKNVTQSNLSLNIDKDNVQL